MNSSCASKQKLQTKLQPFRAILEPDAADGADVGHGWLLQSHCIGFLLQTVLWQQPCSADIKLSPSSKEWLLRGREK